MQDYNTRNFDYKDYNPTKEPTRIELPYWEKGMKIPCPKCGEVMSLSYTHCGIRFKPFVKMKF